MIQASWFQKTLNFRQPVATSRGAMKTRVVWYISLSEAGTMGIGECAPLPGLSVDDLSMIEPTLDKVCNDPVSFINDTSKLSYFPSIRFGLEMAQLDLQHGGGQSYFESFHAIDINGLIWMGSPEFMSAQLSRKLDAGWRCIKMKIGALDLEEELSILQSVRNRYHAREIELRVDANGAFSGQDAKDKLDQLADFDLHSIEQPIQPGQWDLLSELCKVSRVPIALDEELIPLIHEEDRVKMLEKVKPQYCVLKPSLLGGFSETDKWIRLADERNIGWWITSMMESSIGLNAIAQWTSKLNPGGFQGLGTGRLFSNNLPSPIRVVRGTLSTTDSSVWKRTNQFISEWYSGSDEIVLQTSGSTGKPKSVSVNKGWMKHSARLTGKTFGLNQGDTALLCLPIKYVAGKMMIVRALELELDLIVVEPSSRPLMDLDVQIDFAAMVPLQLERSIDQLGKVRTVIVGGGSLNPKLADQLQSIATHVVETYGMTETLTHVAIKHLNGPNRSDSFRALEGVHFETDDRGCLIINAQQLNPTPVITNDLVTLIDRCCFRWLGRYDNVINSGGVKIIPEVVEAKLASVIMCSRFFVAGIPDDSMGEKAVLLVQGDEMEIPLDSLDKYERPKYVYFLPDFVHTDSGKISRKETLKLI